MEIHLEASEVPSISQDLRQDVVVLQQQCDGLITRLSNETDQRQTAGHHVARALEQMSGPMNDIIEFARTRTRHLSEHMRGLRNDLEETKYAANNPRASLDSSVEQINTATEMPCERMDDKFSQADGKLVELCKLCKESEAEVKGVVKKLDTLKKYVDSSIFKMNKETMKWLNVCLEKKSKSASGTAEDLRRDVDARLATVVEKLHELREHASNMHAHHQRAEARCTAENKRDQESFGALTLGQARTKAKIARERKARLRMKKRLVKLDGKN